MMNHDNSVMGPSLQAQKLICVASNKAHWLATMERVATKEECKLVAASSIMEVIKQIPRGAEIECIMIDYSPTTHQWSSIEQMLLENEVIAPVILVLGDKSGFEVTDSVARVAHVVAIDSMQDHEVVETINDARALRSLVEHQFDVLQCHRLYQSLPDRQRKIVDLVVDGAPNKQIATKLEVSVKTIERDRQKAYQRLNVRSTAEMTRVVILGSLHNIVFPSKKPRPHFLTDRTPGGIDNFNPTP